MKEEDTVYKFFLKMHVLDTIEQSVREKPLFQRFKSLLKIVV